MQIDRLLKIINILMDKQKVSAKELSAKFGVSTKTIYRDIDALSIAGIPVITTKGKNGGISILECYKINSAMVNNEEQNSILRGLEILNALKYDDTTEVLPKLKNIFNKPQYDLIDIELSYWGSDDEMKRKFESIKEALFHDKQIKISYIDAYGQKSMREVYPLKLIFKEKTWYLCAYCLKKKDYRLFNTFRIKNIEIINFKFARDKFDPPAINDDIRWKGNYTDVVLKFNSNCKKRIYSDFSVIKMEHTENGCIILRESIIIDSGFFNYIISFGEDVEIMEPKSLKNDIVEYLKNKLKIFKKHL